MLKKLNEKKNNKGFSLVELIVVILIMAVLAVALAPQVMKWVNNARIATDRSNADAIISAVQLYGATTDITAVNEELTGAKGSGNQYHVTSGSGITVDQLDSVLGDGWETQLQPKSDKTVVIEIKGGHPSLKNASDFDIN